MAMAMIDYIIVFVYILAMIGVGVYFQRKASAGIDSYFLGNRNLPWWALGSSGMASNMDVSGTMINTAFIFALGASGFFIEIRGGVTLIMAFLMIFMGKWNRRANVMTMAEWMHLRFGKGKDGDFARIISAVSIIIITIAMITYFAVGSGKFIAQFLGIPTMLGLPGEFWASLIMIALAMIYTIASGLYGVVWTDVFQGVLIFGTILYIGAMVVTSFPIPEVFEISLPLRDGGYMAVETTREAWTNIVPQWQLAIPEESSYSIYNLFGIAILFYLFKVTIEGSGGTSGYMIQRYYSAKSDREAGLLSLFWTFLLAFRWPFIVSIAILGIVYGTQNGVIDDPETVLPVVIGEMVPIGIRGLMVAGLMAAAMSTFDSTVNAGASYWVKDIYQAFINPQASEKKLMAHSRWASVLMVVFGLAFTLLINNINEIWGWITMSIGAGMFVPTLLRWYWWRFNGYGFAWGTIVGMVAAIGQKYFLPDVPEYVSFVWASGMSLTGLLVATFLTSPTDNAVLDNFYRKTRPFGAWGHIRERLKPDIRGQIQAENRRDIIAIFFAVPWQIVLFLTTMTIIMGTWFDFAWLFVILVLLSLGLYFFWYRHLSSEVVINDE
jgi:SSS family solute:Na+ symporter